MSFPVTSLLKLKGVIHCIPLFEEDPNALYVRVQEHERNILIELSLPSKQSKNKEKRSTNSNVKMISSNDLQNITDGLKKQNEKLDEEINLLKEQNQTLKEQNQTLKEQNLTLNDQNKCLIEFHWKPAFELKKRSFLEKFAKKLAEKFPEIAKESSDDAEFLNQLLKDSNVSSELKKLIKFSLNNYGKLSSTVHKEYNKKDYDEICFSSFESAESKKNWQNIYIFLFDENPKFENSD